MLHFLCWKQPNVFNIIISILKAAGLKYENNFPLELSYIFTSVSSLFNNYYWGRGINNLLCRNI